MAKNKNDNYTEAKKRATLKYITEKTRQVLIRYKTEDFERDIYPYIQKSGLPMATFIKQAIKEKIERDFK